MDLRIKLKVSKVGVAVNLGNIKVMISGDITKDWLCKCNIYPCRIGSIRTMANTFCV